MALGKVLKEFGVRLSLIFEKEKVEEARKAIAEVGAQMKEVGLHVAEASAALLEFANISGEHSRALEEQSAQLGINVERLQELEYAAKVAAGVTRDQLVGSLQQLSKTLYEARNNNVEASRTLIRLGVPLEAISDKSMAADQVMMILAERFKTMPDGMMKTALAAEVGGDAFVKLIPLFNKGAQGMASMGKEARSFGVIMNKAAIEEGAEFDRQLSKIWIVLKNITFVIGSQLIKYLGPIVLEFEKWIIANRKFIASGIATVMKSFGTSLGIIFKVLSALTSGFKVLVSVLGGLQRVTTLIALAMGFLTSVKIVSGVFTLIKNFRALGGVIGVLTNPIGLVSAAMVALFLIIQDWFSDDSIIKEWIDDFKEEFPNAAKGIIDVFNTVKSVITDVTSAVTQLWSIFKGMVSGAESFGSAVSKAVQPLSKLLQYSPLGMIQKGVSSAMDYFKGPSATSVTGAGASAPIQNNNMSANIIVTVPTGTSPKAGADMVSSGVEKGFHQILRQTRDQAIGGLAY